MVDNVRKELYFAFRSLVNSPVMTKSLPFDISELFSSQKNADKAKKALKKEFTEASKVYFSRFLKNDEIDASALLENLSQYEKPMRRHLGLAQYEYLKLIATLSKLTEVKKRGLIA